MILLVDLGNSRLKWASWMPGTPVEGSAAPWRGLDMHAVLDRVWDTLPRPDRVLAVSVAAADVSAVLATWCRARWGIVVEVVTSQPVGHGVRNGYRDPSRLGTDRWAALIGARRRCDSPCCVIDCGTAITLDAMDGRGEHQGGVIVPGLALMGSAVLHGTARVTGVAEYTTLDVLARDTSAAVAAGALHAVVGGVERVVGAMSERLGDPLVRLLTGGDAPVVAPLLGPGYRMVPTLVLEGLAVVAEGPAEVQP
jgi:type III pantothenate kinase